jgi:hypothetical protein
MTRLNVKPHAMRPALSTYPCGDRSMNMKEQSDNKAGDQK